MNIKHQLRRLSPLAILLVAITAVLALSPSAHAQSTATVQMHAFGTGTPSLAARAEIDGTIRFKPDNNNDFRQRWNRETVQSGVFRFSRAGVLNACMRPPTGLSPANSGPIVLGSCSGTAAQWSRVAVAGPGDYYVNRATGHHLATDLCISEFCSDQLFAMQSSLVPFVPDVPRISLEFL
jgi:hypothetical protein